MRRLTRCDGRRPPTCAHNERRKHKGVGSSEGGIAEQAMRQALCSGGGAVQTIASLSSNPLTTVLQHPADAVAEAISTPRWQAASTKGGRSRDCDDYAEHVCLSAKPNEGTNNKRQSKEALQLSLKVVLLWGERRRGGQRELRQNAEKAAVTRTKRSTRNHTHARTHTQAHTHPSRTRHARSMQVLVTERSGTNAREGERQTRIDE